MTMSARSRRIDCEPTLELFPTSSLGRLPARTSAAPTPRARASTASGRASSSKPSASSERSALVGSLLRTALISELGALTPSSLRWKTSTTPAGRPWFVLETSAPTMSVPDRGSLVATPTKSSKVRSAAFSAGRTPSIREALPTPIASFQMGGQSNPGLKAKGVVYPALGPLLEISAGRMDPGRFRGDMEGWARLSTPRASDMKAGGHGDTGRMGTVGHQLQKALMPTPSKRDTRSGKASQGTWDRLRGGP